MHCDHEPTPHPSQEGNGQDADECLLPSREGNFRGADESLLPSWEKLVAGRFMEIRSGGEDVSADPKDAGQAT